MNNILIVEDDKEINQLLAGFLTENGYGTVSLFDGLHIEETMKRHRFHLVILDIMLPFKSGDQVLKDIRSYSDIPVIIISARGMTQNKIDLLRAGADDYITKPFDLEETLARIESALRRTVLQKTPASRLQYRELVLDTQNHTAQLKGQELSLTAKEYRILALLLQHPEKIFSKANLFESIWGTEYLSEDNTLNVHISNLRNKLKSVCPCDEYIDTVWGIGYRLHAD